MIIWTTETNAPIFNHRKRQEHFLCPESAKVGGFRIQNTPEMADPNALVFMCAVSRLRKRSRSTQHMKKRSCAATRAFPRLQAGAGALGAVSAPAQALAYPHCAHRELRRKSSLFSEVYIRRNEILEHSVHLKQNAILKGEQNDS